MLEFKLCVAAIPAVLAFGARFTASRRACSASCSACRCTSSGMRSPAWFCGTWAIPTLWKTLVAEERGFVMPLVARRRARLHDVPRVPAPRSSTSWRSARALLVVQAIGTFYIRELTAEMVFTFGGDGIGMVLAAVLMATFFFGKRTQLYKGWLRWGFLVIGAAAFSDMFATWWAARTDIGKIPYGEIEGVGLSDAAKLVELHGWSVQALVRRFLTVGFACLAALAAVYAWGVWAAWQRAKDWK